LPIVRHNRRKRRSRETRPSLPSALFRLEEIGRWCGWEVKFDFQGWPWLANGLTPKALRNPEATLRHGDKSSNSVEEMGGEVAVIFPLLKFWHSLFLEV
jgi:hypothetical protein